MAKINLQDIPVSKINPAPYNPRRELQPGEHEYETIEQSLAEFDLVEPLVWNKRTGNLVSGHQRFKILKARGEKTVPCSVVDLPIEKEKALNITLNNPNVGGDWDEQLLGNLLKELESQMPDLYDSLNMAPLRQEADLQMRGGMDENGSHLSGFEEPEDELPGPPEMDLLPYEHYDYIVVFFKDSRDFLSAMDHFGLQKVKVPGYVGKKTIGVGRVINGSKYMQRVKELEARAQAAKTPAKKGAAA
ncbi:MAG TPA: ParB N-terminal domain-containing protein [Candidatus Acidoferrales bacterium]|nr:ParB N-terminal domain-containing protein [Candidatus Acidoferrales bacterium]